MFHDASRLRGFCVQDGSLSIGSLWALVIGKRSWAVDGIVIQTGGQLEEECVLISRPALSEMSAEDERLTVSLALPDAGDADASQSLNLDSSPYVEKLKSICGPPPDWHIERPTAYLAYPVPIVQSFYVKAESEKENETDDCGPEPLSCRNLIGCQVEALDGRAGVIEDLLLDDKDWMVRYAILDTGRWLPGKKIVLATTWLRHSAEDVRAMVTDLDLADIKGGPEFDRTDQFSRHDEEVLFRHYQREPYWIGSDQKGPFE